MRIERERLEQNNERLRKDLQAAQSADLAYAQVREVPIVTEVNIKRVPNLMYKTADIHIQSVLSSGWS